MTSLIETITNKAEASFEQPVTNRNYDDWHDHWVATGRAWKDELAKEGLTETCTKIDALIDEAVQWQQKRKIPKIWHCKLVMDYFDAQFVEYKLGWESKSFWFVPGTWRHE